MQLQVYKVACYGITCHWIMLTFVQRLFGISEFTFSIHWCDDSARLHARIISSICNVCAPFIWNIFWSNAHKDINLHIVIMQIWIGIKVLFQYYYRGNFQIPNTLTQHFVFLHKGLHSLLKQSVKFMLRLLLCIIYYGTCIR